MREEEECRQCGLRARDAQGRRQLHQLLDIPADVESGSGTCSQWSCEGDESCEVSSPCHHDDATVCTMGYTVQQTLPSLPAKEGDLDPFKPTQEQLVLAEQRKRGKWAACKTVCVEGPHFSVKGPSREQRWLGTLTMMQPSQLAVVLQELPIFNILMVRLQLLFVLCAVAPGCCSCIDRSKALCWCLPCCAAFGACCLVLVFRV